MSPARRPRLSFDQWPAAVYAIGDVHGCLDQLQALEAAIVADAAGIAGEKWIITLGDYIDRGPDSPAVLDHVVSAAPPGFRRIALIGNHEQLLLDFLDNAPAFTDWLEWGGLATARAYGVPDDPGQRWRQAPQVYAERLRPMIPPRHLEMLANLPTCVSVPGFIFVHAGLRPGIALEHQDDRDLMWIRAPFLNRRVSSEFTIVHGHTPVSAVEMAPGRIDIDTGCFFSGVLTALRVLPDGTTSILEARGAPSDYVPAAQRR